MRKAFKAKAKVEREVKGQIGGGENDAYLRYRSRCGLGFEMKLVYFESSRPLSSFDEGLYPLACEEDVRCSATLVRRFKLLEVYTEHGFTVVNSYQRLQAHVRATIEHTSQPSIGATIEYRSDKMLLLTWNDFSTLLKASVCDSVTPRSMPQHGSSTPIDESVITYTPIEWYTHVDAEPAFDVGRTEEHIVEQVRVDEVINGSVEDDVVHGSCGEDVKHGNGQVVVKETSGEQVYYDVDGIDSAYETQCHVDSSKDAGVADDDDDDDNDVDYDLLMDEENEIIKPNVVVHMFGISNDVSFDNIGVTRLVLKDVLE
nr:hypothetical protein [Tanacetum cinerariifolium]